jgi:hypothetical protein
MGGFFFRLNLGISYMFFSFEAWNGYVQYGSNIRLAQRVAQGIPFLNSRPPKNIFFPPIPHFP